MPPPPSSARRRIFTQFLTHKSTHLSRDVGNRHAVIRNWLNTPLGSAAVERNNVGPFARRIFRPFSGSAEWICGRGRSHFVAARPRSRCCLCWQRPCGPSQSSPSSSAPTSFALSLPIPNPNAHITVYMWHGPLTTTTVHVKSIKEHYRVTIQAVQNLPLTSMWKLCFSMRSLY